MIKTLGVGFIGNGEYNSRSNKRIYTAWFEMLRRCYCPKSLSIYTTYIQCSVDERWYNFQNFYSDYLRMSGHSLDWDLDKDVLIKGNKIYSNETCVLLPHRLNSILSKVNTKRGELPIGVSRANSKKNPFRAFCSINETNTYLGAFLTPELAFQAYKQTKEYEIKRVANLYKFQLDPRAYKALMNYEVEIDD